MQTTLYLCSTDLLFVFNRPFICVQLTFYLCSTDLLFVFNRGCDLFDRGYSRSDRPGGRLDRRGARFDRGYSRSDRPGGRLDRRGGRFDRGYSRSNRGCSPFDRGRDAIPHTHTQACMIQIGSSVAIEATTSVWRGAITFRARCGFGHTGMLRASDLDPENKVQLAKMKKRLSESYVVRCSVILCI